LKAMSREGVEAIVLSSSCTVYGQPDELPVSEDSPTQEPDSPYGRTKRICEWAISDEVRSEAIPKGLSLRYFNPIGAHPSGAIGEESPDRPSNLVPFITKTALGKLNELVVNGDDYDTPDGTCIRDYIHVVDLARAHVKGLERLERTEKSSYEVFNVGTGQGASVMEAIRAFEEANGMQLPYRIGPRRPGDVEQIWADTRKAERELGWKPRYSLRDAMRHAWLWEQRRAEKGDLYKE
jgi:UDP-glucose 4-epimerase